jgi:hypothetical protein
MYLKPYEISNCTKSSVFDKLLAKGLKKKLKHTVACKNKFVYSVDVI